MQGHPTPHPTAGGSPIRFGRVTLTPALEAFRHAMNGEMMALLRSLPPAVHADAVVFFMAHFRTPFFPEFNYFRNYPAPAWSIVHWMAPEGLSRGRRRSEMCRQSRRAHAMALFLHPLDDHLHDGQLPATHLHLLLRSQAWLRMRTALDRMAADVPGGTAIVDRLVDAYYAAIATRPEAETLDGYCAHFRRQMATWMIVPTLLAAKTAAGDAACGDLQDAYGAFGTAWRLLDDLQDMDADWAGGSRSAVYYALPADDRQWWGPKPEEDTAARREKIQAAIAGEGIAATLRRRIDRELASAAAMLEALHMRELAQEMRCLAAPLADGRTIP
jgi:hypothetical protein